MTVSQQTFRTALLDAEIPVPEGLRDAEGAAAGRRFSVYRNNVIVSLSEALATAFPLVRKLIGAESFHRLAMLYVRAHPPASPLMMFYGRHFPTYLEAFEPLRHLGYLPDCARLDLAMRQSYHAADSVPFDATPLQTGDQDAFETRMVLAPASIVLKSAWPLFDLWRFNTVPGAPKPRAVSQDVLVTRPDFDPQPHLLATGDAEWLERLNSGIPFGQATEQTLEHEPDFDLTQALTLALSSHALMNDTKKEN
ncbi:MAG: DNA-binding domain-containing protein [Roseobacter sp.]